MKKQSRVKIKSEKPKNKNLNTNMSSAKREKYDEFYTQRSDIEREFALSGKYEAQFHGKVVFCNCDDPYESNFFKFFAENFDALGLKKLIATSYVGSPVAGTSLPLLEIAGLKKKRGKAYVAEINEVPDRNNDGAIGLDDVRLLLEHDNNAVHPLEGDGDFRSEECMRFLKEADIVVTNPPFSLFPEYVRLLTTYKKKFLIIGNKSAITYRETFDLIKENKMWVGATPMSKDLLFDVPKEYAKVLVSQGKEGRNYRIVDGVVKARSASIWFTNLDHKKHHEKIPLYKYYSPKKYPTYDNYDAIEVEKVKEIPKDYPRKMGVPISFLDKYNPKQFEIIGSFNAGAHGKEIGAVKTETITKGKTIMWNGPVINKEPKFKRIIIKRRNGK